MNTLIVDIRTPYQLKKVKEIILNNFLKDYPNVIFCVRTDIKNTDSLVLHGRVVLYDFSPAKYFVALKYLFFYITKLRPIVFGGFDLLTALNHGPLYRVFSLFKKGKTILYEDGISTFLKIKKSIFIYNKYKFLYSTNYDFAIMDDSVERLLPDDILSKVVTYPKGIAQIKADFINFFVSSSCVEYGFDSMTDYKRRFSDLIPSLSSNPLYVSFHHNEVRSEEKLSFMRSLIPDIQIVGKDIPLEDMLESCFIGEIAAPYNSVALNILRYFDYTGMHLYNDNGPNMSTRIELFNNISFSSEVKFYV